MKRGIGGFLVLVLFGLGLAADAARGAPAAERSATLLLVPARPRVVQLAFDLAAMRAVTVVAWHGDAKTAEPVLHVWSGSDWQYVSLPAFAEQSFLPGQVGEALVVGDDQLVPAALLNSMAWCPNVRRIATINIADLLNGLDRSLAFRDREWQWLADRYELTLADVNAARRSKNPYATPRSQLPLEKREFRREPGGPPPAQLIEEQPAAAPESAPAVQPAAEKPPK